LCARIAYAGRVIRGRVAILALLTGLNLLNYLDRYVVSAVGPRIQEELHINDGPFGFVVSAFMIGYMITSPIFGWLGDRYPRKGLIALGILIWSVATALSGFAESYWHLVAARIAVGVGEASYATLGPTIIDDIAPKEMKNRYLAVFYAAIPIGSALGFIVGGEVGTRYDWRTAFFVAGAPGILLALTVLFIHEPARAASAGGEEAKADEPRRTNIESYKTLARTPLYVTTIAGYIAQTFALGGFTTWAAPFLYRKLCLELDDAANAFGVVTVITGIVGTALGGWLGDRFQGENRLRTALKICGWSSALAAPLALAALLFPSAPGAIAMIGLCEIAVFVSVAPVNVAVLHSVPPWMRANAMAVSILAIHLLGDMISPSLIGFISDGFGDVKAFCQGARGLQIGMYTLPAALLVSALFWWGAARKAKDGELETQSPR
jgi:MFS family permease